jgi:translation elongation factor EF-Tu-like GTPase
MTEPLPWVTPESLRNWLSPDQAAQVAGNEAQRQINRALSSVSVLLTAVPDPANDAHRQAMAEAIMLTIEQRLTVGDYGSVVGGRITIGHVSYGSDSVSSGSSQQAPSSVPPVALWQLRNAGLLSSAVVAY